MIEKNNYYKFSNSDFFTIAGKDRYSFLQGLVSNDLKKLENEDIIYSSLLSPQGKFLFDFFVSNYGETYLIECNKKFTEELLKKLSLYKLRSEIEINVERKLKSYTINSINYELLSSFKKNEKFKISLDPRFKNYFLKIYTTPVYFEEIVKTLDLLNCSKSDFEDIRIKNVIPDFSIEANLGKSLLLELRFDELNGIDWNKGCYMGQELTARTKYRGKIKKKLFGVKLNGKVDSDEIVYEKKIVGSLQNHFGEYGIAIVDEKIVENCLRNSLCLTIGKIKVIPFIPKWSNSIIPN
mgnify:CR=1 FL=1|tara:strand:+ start:233 stop:1117 length:885 start_codon:yes stop_codon:yes gene_type:complete